MLIAGIDVRPGLVVHLANTLRASDAAYTAAMLERALDANQPIVALTVEDREHILAVLEHPPAGLAELRTALLQEPLDRLRDVLP